jgi:hypothetical protein
VISPTQPPSSSRSAFVQVRRLTPGRRPPTLALEVLDEAFRIEHSARPTGRATTTNPGGWPRRHRRDRANRLPRRHHRPGRAGHPGRGDPRRPPHRGPHRRRATLMFFDLDTRELLRTRPNPIPPDKAILLRGVRPVGPPPRPSAEPITVQREPPTPASSASAARRLPSAGLTGTRPSPSTSPRPPWPSSSTAKPGSCGAPPPCPSVTSKPTGHGRSPQSPSPDVAHQVAKNCRASTDGSQRGRSRVRTGLTDAGRAAGRGRRSLPGWLRRLVRRGGAC